MRRQIQEIQMRGNEHLHFQCSHIELPRNTNDKQSLFERRKNGIKDMQTAPVNNLY
jgi:hypothetical protein